MTEEHLAVLRRHMVELIAIQADLLEDELGEAALDGRVLEAMLRVPRHRFVPAPFTALAYDDTPLPIGFDKTISQPFLCALMTDLLAPGPGGEAVLEVGTGLGYQTALLAELAGRVRSVEIVEELAGPSYAWTGSATPRSASASGTGRAAGPSTRPSTRAWCPRGPSGCRRRCSSSSSRAGVWSCRWAPRRGSGSPRSTRAPGSPASGR
jgi:Protein-L-isoaspartate(D-aspartate) O-methyltransferase (PCMT)